MTYDKKLKCGVFIDGSNVFWGSMDMKPEERWMVDYEKFKKYLKDKYRPILFKYYGATDDAPRTAEHAESARRQKSFYAKLAGMGYDVITKPLKYIKNDNGDYTTKGDMDIELTMDVMGALADLETIILVGGDSDYLPLIKSVHSQGKFIRIISFDELLSWELRTFALKNTRCNFTTLDSIKSDIERVVDA